MSLRVTLPICACAVLAWPAVALAANPVPIRIELDAPPGCASADDFYAALRTRSEQVRLGHAGEQAVEVVVKLEPGSDVLHGELRVIDEHGDMESRTVDGSSCAAVVEALSLTAALAFEAAQERKRTAPLEPSQSGGAPASSTPENGEDDDGGSESSLRLRPSLAAQAVLARVLTKQVSSGAAIEGRLGWESQGRLGPSVGLAVVHASSEPLSSTGSVSSRWTVAVLSGCPVRVALGALEIAPCVTASGGVVAVRGLDVENPRSVGRSWWGVGALLRAGAPLGGGVLAELSAGASLPLVERTFVTTPSETTVSETPPISPLASLGLSYKF